MSKTSIIRALEDRLAAGHRRVLSDWRALLLLRQASLALPPEERRWEKVPSSLTDARVLLARLVAQGALSPLSDLSFIYTVQSPYARTEPIEEYEILMELHPYAVLSHHSAFAFHQLTDELPSGYFLTISGDGAGQLLPIGTTPADWDGLTLVPGRRPETLHGRSITWHREAPKRFFGFEEYQPRGYPVRVTTPERTLLDGLRHPDWCGGLSQVLHAWRRSADTLNLDRVIADTEQLDIAVLRQRVGFVLDELGLRHPGMTPWPSKAQRGGSSKLHGGLPFASTYSERWSLSINAPTTALHEDSL
jgi:predicted transcriptional regulator of viral defense system